VILRPGEKMNLLKLGEGPFPLPIGQKRHDVLNQFDVRKIESKPGDPADTVHLELIPKSGTSLARKFKSIDTWVSLPDEMPVRISTLDFTGATERSTDLSNVQINPDLTDADFELPKIDEKEWNLIEEPYQDSQPQPGK
jgi:outer membrane lipoprotein-sorting protein